MTIEERNQKRFDIFRGILWVMQATGLHSTQGLFELEFKAQMNERIGECTKEDLIWMHDNLDQFIEECKE